MMLMLNVAGVMTVMVILGSIVYRVRHNCFDIEELEFLGPVAIILWLFGGFLIGILMTQHGMFGSVLAWMGFLPWLGCPIYLLTQTMEDPDA